jgi:hypothetical protein
VREALTRRNFIRTAAGILVPAWYVRGQQISFSGQIVRSGQQMTSPQGIIFQDAVESGTLLTTDTPPGKWNYVVGLAGTVTASAAAARSGSYGIQIHYEDLTPPADVNRYVVKDGLSRTHLFCRAYVKFHVNAGGSTDYVQRKLFWFDNGVALGGYNWTVILTSWWKTPIDGKIWLAMTANVGPGGTPWQDWDLIALNYDTWYGIELEVTMNTPGVDNGTYSLWVNGAFVASGTGKSYSGTNADPISRFRLGVQADSGEVVDEERYWDDIKISTSYIGL